MSRRRAQKTLTDAAILAASVLHHSPDEAARALAQLVLDLQRHYQTRPAPRALRRRARAQLRRAEARFQELEEAAALIDATATEVERNCVDVEVLRVRTAAMKTAVSQEEQRVALERAALAGWGLPGGSLA